MEFKMFRGIIKVSNSKKIEKEYHKDQMLKYRVINLLTLMDIINYLIKQHITIYTGEVLPRETWQLNRHLTTVVLQVG